MLRNLLRSMLPKQISDTTRWQKDDSLALDWDSRTRQMAELVPPGSSVLEFGAGRMTLASCLPASCSYIPSDIVKRRLDTFVCDLNISNLPEFPRHQVAFFSGVLEYVLDVPRLVAHLSANTQVFILSYACLEDHRNKLNRRSSGWVNDYDSEALEEILRKAGFKADYVGTWKSQKIFRFIRSD
jgi:hypothetical protein